jgi:hypothetical protein
MIVGWVSLYSIQYCTCSCTRYLGVALVRSRVGNCLCVCVFVCVCDGVCVWCVCVRHKCIGLLKGGPVWPSRAGRTGPSRAGRAGPSRAGRAGPSPPPPPPAPPRPPGMDTEPSLLERELMDKMPYPMLKSKGKSCMVLDPSHVKQLSLIHVCKIGLKEYFLLSLYYKNR